MASRARNRRRFKSSTSRLTMQKLRHQACSDTDFVRSALAEAAARRAESQPHVAEQLAAARAELGAIRPGDEVGSAQRVDDSIGRYAAGCGPFATDHLPAELPRGMSIRVDGEPATCLHGQPEQSLGRLVPLGTGVELHGS